MTSGRLLREAAFFCCILKPDLRTGHEPRNVIECRCHLSRLNLEGFSLRRFLILSVLDLRIIYATSSTIMPIRYIFMFPGAIISLFNSLFR